MDTPEWGHTGTSTHSLCHRPPEGRSWRGWTSSADMILHAKKKLSEINQTDNWIIVHVKCWCANDTKEIDASPPHLYKYDD